MVKTVLLEIHHLYYWPNFQPVIEELVSRKNYIIHVSTPFRNSRKQENIFRSLCSNFSIQFISSDNEDNRIKKIIGNRYDVIIIGNVGQINKIAIKKSIVVMVYHGIGLKQSYYKDINNRIDIRSVESSKRYDELVNRGHKNLALTGYTKLDRLYSIKNHEISSYQKSLDLNPVKSTILYAPSFYPTSIEKIAPFIPTISQDFNVIIKLHGFSWEQKRFRYQSELCTELANGNKDVKLIPNEKIDIIPFYKISDLLISDISSTIFEYLPLDRPIIQAECFTLRLKHKIFNYRFMKKMDRTRSQEVDFTYKIFDPEELLSRIYFAIDNPDEMSENRSKACRNFLYKTDGKASKRLVDAIENF